MSSAHATPQRVDQLIERICNLVAEGRGSVARQELEDACDEEVMLVVAQLEFMFALTRALEDRMYEEAIDLSLPWGKQEFAHQRVIEAYNTVLTAISHQAEESGDEDLATYASDQLVLTN